MSSVKIWRRPQVLLALCLVSIGGVVTLLGRLATGPAVALKRVELSNEVGAKAYPAFAPDGQHLAYSARATSSKDETFHVFIRDVTEGPGRQLTTGPANDISPAWSPDGKQIAFVRLGEGQGECVIVPASAGEERKIPGCAAPGDETQPFPSVAWMRDGQSLVVVRVADGQPPSLARLSLADGIFHPLTHPPAGAEDSTPAVSPDGNSIAFVRSTGADNANIFVTDTTGATPPHAVTFDGRGIRGIAWTRDGQDLLYTGYRVGGWRLWRVPAYGGSPRDLIIAGRDANYVTVAPVGNRMVYTVSPTVSSIWRAELGGDPVVEHAIIRSSGRENGPRYSPDGKSIADISDQTGNDEIWLSDSDGGNRVQVTGFKGPELARIRWSPDGKSLIFDTNGEQGNDLYIVPAVAGGKTVRVQLGALNGSWSRDGKSIYFQARDRIWKAAVNGGDPQQISPHDGAAQPVESVDGKFVYFRNRRAFWRVPVAGGEEEQAIIPEHELMWSTTLQPTKQGMYYFEYERSAGEPVVSFFDFAEKKSSVIFHVKHGGGRDATYSVSPDGKYVLYARVDQSQTNFEVVENFR